MFRGVVSLIGYCSRFFCGLCGLCGQNIPRFRSGFTNSASVHYVHDVHNVHIPAYSWLFMHMLANGHYAKEYGLYGLHGLYGQNIRSKNCNKSCYLLPFA